MHHPLAGAIIASPLGMYDEPDMRSPLMSIAALKLEAGTMAAGAVAHGSSLLAQLLTGMDCITCTVKPNMQPSGVPGQ